MGAALARGRNVWAKVAHINPYDAPYADLDATGAIPSGANPVFAYRPRCSLQTITVPSEDGGERSINITRC
jgi:hypothetical protein